MERRVIRTDTTDIVRPVIDLQAQVADLLREVDRGSEARESSPDHDDAHGAPFVDAVRDEGRQTQGRGDVARFLSGGGARRGSVRRGRVVQGYYHCVAERG